MLKLILPLTIIPIYSKRRNWNPSLTYIYFTLLLVGLFPTHGFPHIRLMIWTIQTINITLTTLSMWISALIVKASWKFVVHKKKEKNLILYINLLLIILMLAFCTNNTIIFYILFEASLIPTFLIILGWGYQPERLEATNYLIIYTILASLPLLMSILILTNKRGSMIFFCINGTQQINYYWWLIAIIAFLVKTPIYLTHLWLPKAHVEAPVAGSMSLAAILLKLGRYGLIIISRYSTKTNNIIIYFISSLSLLGALISGFICTRQTDLKSLIAYSSISHIALVTARILTNTVWGWRGALVLMLAHGLCSSSIFNYANIVTDITRSRRIYLNKGIITLVPSLVIWWFIIGVINIGAPPSINLIREIVIITSIISSTISLILFLRVVAFITAAYNLMIYTSTSHGNKINFMSARNNINYRHYLINFMHITPTLRLISSPKIISLFI